MTITQGTFSYLPPLADTEIEAQIRYAIARGCAISVEHTGDAHPRNTYWDMWGLPLFDLTDPAAAMASLRACREAFPDDYVKLNAFDPSRSRRTFAWSLIVQRPGREPALVLEREHRPGRTNGYSLRSSAAAAVR